MGDGVSQTQPYPEFGISILSIKCESEEYEIVVLTVDRTAILQNNSPQQLMDPGPFSFSCLLGNIEIDSALCDLGASVSMIPLSICEKLNMGSPKRIEMHLRFADGSIKKPVGILENVPLRVGNLVIPVDFVVLEMKQDLQSSIILGRPFLATAGAVIDVRNGRWTFNLGDKIVEFNLSSAAESSSQEDSPSQVYAINQVVSLNSASPVGYENLLENYIRPAFERPRLQEIVSKNIQSIDLGGDDRNEISGEAFFEIRNRAMMRFPCQLFHMRDYWRDYLRLHCHPVEEFVTDLTFTPPSFWDLETDCCEQVRERVFWLLDMISLILGLIKDYSPKSLGDQGRHMAMSFYQRYAEELIYGLASHTDPNIITMLLQDLQVAGLPVFKEGKWIAVNPHPEALIVNMGNQIPTGPWAQVI